MLPSIPRHLEARLPSIKVLIVDDDHYMRKVVRTMLMALGVKLIHEANDGAAGLNMIRELNPDIVFLLGNADDGRAAVHPGGAFAGLVSGAGRADHPADRTRRSLARHRGGALRGS